VSLRPVGSGVILVSCPLNKHAPSLRSKWAAGKAVRAGLALRGRISRAIRNRSRRRGTAAGPFSSQPFGPRPVGCFSAPRPRDSLLTYRFRYARRHCQSGSDRLEKQPTDLRRKVCLFRGQDIRGSNRFDAEEGLRPTVRTGVAGQLPRKTRPSSE
jgi:hypothetical protein